MDLVSWEQVAARIGSAFAEYRKSTEKKYKRYQD